MSYGTLSVFICLKVIYRTLTFDLEFRMFITDAYATVAPPWCQIKLVNKRHLLASFDWSPSSGTIC